MRLTGAEVLAETLVRQGFRVVTGYPGSPATGVMEHYKSLVHGRQGWSGTWMINEKVSFEYAVGHAMAGQRSATVLKNVGFNLIMDSLVITALTGVKAACILLLGDDPGARQSSHEEDARPLVVAAEVPLLEPTSPSSAVRALNRAVEISEGFGVPVVVRFTPTLTKEWEEVDLPDNFLVSPKPQEEMGEVTGFTCMPHQAVGLHRRLHEALEHLAEEGRLSDWTGAGSRGIIAVGDSWLKVRMIVNAAGMDDIRVLRLEEVYPLPRKILRSFLTGLDRVLVVEETLPVVEERMAAFCHQEGAAAMVWGKLSGHQPREDILRAGHIYDGIVALTDGVADNKIRAQLVEDTEGWGQGKSLCRGCPYGKVVEALQGYWSSRGIAEPVLTAEPGCGVRMYYQPYQKVDLLLCMGSATPLSAAMAARFPGEKRPVAVIGESAFLNSGVPALIQACAMRVPILVIVVNNYSAALTGFQPTLELEPEQTVQTLENVIRGAGPAFFTSVNEREIERLPIIIDKAHTAHGTAVILVNAPCTGTP